LAASVVGYHRKVPAVQTQCRFSRISGLVKLARLTQSISLWDCARERLQSANTNAARPFSGDKALAIGMKNGCVAPALGEKGGDFFARKYIPKTLKSSCAGDENTAIGAKVRAGSHASSTLGVKPPKFVIMDHLQQPYAGDAFVSNTDAQALVIRTELDGRGMRGIAQDLAATLSAP
jgi:hypothetical protein